MQIFAIKFMKLSALSIYIDGLQSRGRYSFQKQELLQNLPLSESTLINALSRLIRKKRIALIRQGFYVIIPLEYQASGIIPPSWFVDDLMHFLELPYYVGGLSAAALHGASHQQAQEFQIITDRPVRPIVRAGLRLRFLMKSSGATQTIKMKTETGQMSVSSPAATALDLVRYHRQFGGYSAILPVLEELSEAITSEDLLHACQSETPIIYVQRLGYLLEQLENRANLQNLKKWIEKQTLLPTPLESGTDRSGLSADPIWRVIPNVDLENIA